MNIGTNLNLSSFISAINDHERKYKQFTVVLIRLHRSIVYKLMQEEKFRNIPSEIAEVYNFHLNPKHCPDSVVCMFKGSRETRKFRGIARQRESPLKIPFKIWRGNVLEYDQEISNIENPVQRCIANACDYFRFTMELPDPDTYIEHAVGSTQLSQVAPPPAKRISIEGMILYFPCVNGKETKPRHQLVDLSHDEDQPYPSPEVADTIATKFDSNVFSVFWQDRLVPESVVSSLPFFPFLKRKSVQAKNAGEIAANWTERIKGFLFFDWSFTQISNNKLKIQVDPNLHEWINSKSVESNTIFNPKEIKKSFKTWLEENHKKHDEEFLLSDRLNTKSSSSFSSSAGQSQYDSSRSYFRTLNYANGKRMLGVKSQFKAQSKPSLITSQSSSSSAPIATSSTIIAEVVDFEVHEELYSEQDVYYGPCHIRYHRLPLEVFGNKVHTIPATFINYKDNDTFKVTAADLRAYTDKVPHGIKLYLFETDKIETPILIDRNTELVPANQYYKIGVQIVDGKGDFVTTSAANSKQKLKVGIVAWTPDKNGEMVSYSFDKTTDLFVLKDGNDEKTPTVTKKNIADCYYSFYNVSFKVAGNIKIETTVYDCDNKIVLKSSITLKVNAISGQVKDYVISIPPHSLLILDEFLPPFEIQLTDQFGNPVQFVGKVTPAIQHEQVSFGYKRGTNLLVEAGDRGRQVFLGGDWKVSLKKKGNPQFLSTERYKESEDVEVTVAVTLEPNDGEKINLKRQKLPLKISPGKPLKFISISSSDIRVRNGESIPFIRLACIDLYGIRTAPTEDDVWRLKADSGPLQDYLNDQNFEVEASGEFVLTNIPLHVPNVPFGGTQIIQVLRLETLRPTLKDFSPYNLQIVILPNIVFSAITIFYRGARLEGSIAAAIGEEVSGLTVQLIDDKGDAMDITEIDVEVSITLMNAPKKTKIAPIKSNSNELPSIIVPREIGQHTYLVKVRALDKELTTDVDVDATSGEASAWHLLLSKDFDSGIMSGESADMRKKVKGVCLVDALGNIVNFDERIHLPPCVFIHSLAENTVESLEDLNEDEMDVLEHSSVHARTDAGLEENGESLSLQDVPGKLSLQQAEILIDKTVSNGYADNKERNVVGFILSEDAVLIKEKDSTRRLIMKVSDEENRFVACSQNVKMIPGLPRQILLSSEEMRLPPNSILSLEVAKFSQITDLKIHLVDYQGNLSTTKGVKNLAVKLSDRNGNVHFTKKNIKSNIVCNGRVAFNDGPSLVEPPIFSPTQASQEVSNNGLVFDCEGSYLYESKEMSICPAHLSCTLKQFNNVIDLKVFEVLIEPTSGMRTSSHTNPSTRCTLEQLSNEVLVRSCDDSLPVVLVQAETDNGEPYVIRQCIVTIIANEVPAEKQPRGRKPSKNKQTVVTLNIEDLYIIEVDEVLGGLQLLPASTTIGTSIPLGTYTIIIRYEEKRCEFSMLRSNQKNFSKCFTLTVVAGESYQLQPDLRTAQALTGLVLTTLKGSNVSKKYSHIGTNLTFNLFDRYNNPCAFRADGLMSCKVFPPDNDTSKSRIPILENSSQEGYLFGTISDPPTNHGCLFPSISLADASAYHGADYDDGEFELRFCYYPVNTNPADWESHPFFVTAFTFTSSASMAAAMTEKKNILLPLQEARKRWMNADTELREIDIRITLMMDSQRFPNEIREIVRSSLTGSEKLEELRIQQSRREKEMQDRNLRSSQLRPVVKNFVPTNPMLFAGKEVVGLPLDFGFVDNEDEAKILSWAGRGQLDAVVVKDSSIGKELFQSGVKAWPLDQIVPFKVSLKVQYRLLDMCNCCKCKCNNDVADPRQQQERRQATKRGRKGANDDSVGGDCDPRGWILGQTARESALHGELDPTGQRDGVPARYRIPCNLWSFDPFR